MDEVILKEGSRESDRSWQVEADRGGAGRDPPDAHTAWGSGKMDGWVRQKTKNLEEIVGLQSPGGAARTWQLPALTLARRRQVEGRRRWKGSTSVGVQVPWR